jgi:hypothetical protein
VTPHRRDPVHWRREAFAGAWRLVLRQRRIPQILERRRGFIMLALQRVLSFANSMGELDTGQSNGRGPIRLEVQHRRASPFDGSMILLDHVIEISARADLYGPPPGIFLRE